MAALAPNLDSLDLDSIGRRYLSRKNVGKASEALRYSCFGILFLIFVFSTQFLVQDLFSPSKELGSIQETVQKGQALDSGGTGEDTGREQFTRKDARLIRETVLFGVVAQPEVAPAAEQKDDTPAETPLPFALIGTFVNAGGGSVAIIEEKKKRVQEVFGIGEEVFELAKLKGVYSNYIELDRNGKIEKLTIDDTEVAGGGGPLPPGAEEILVDEKELNTALDNLPLLLTQARAVPYFKEGKSVGLRLFAIKTGSLYEKIGLKNGDILKNINGKNLGDFSQAMKLFEQLREERSLNLELERSRKPKTYQYTIQ